MKIVCILSLFLSLSLSGFSQLKKGQVDPSKVPAHHQHYLPEYTFDAPSDPTLWKKQKPGLNVSFATTDELFLRSEVPLISTNGTTWETSSWKGERLNAQILVWSPDTLRQVRAQLKDLVGPGNKVIRKEQIKINLVRYVLSNFPYGARALNCSSGVADSAYLMPDRFESFDRFDLPGGTTRPLWVTIDVPGDTDPGIYQGTIEIFTEKQQQALNLKVNIQNQTLPVPAEWRFRLDLWQNPWVVATYYQVEPWSDEHISLLKKHLKLYADAGGKYITTYAVHSPWSDNSYEVEGAMIDWVKQRDGSWKFGYAIFDQYVELAMDLGIREAITVYTPVPWGYRFRYLDEATGNYVHAEWSPETTAFKTVWNIFMDNLKTHLTEKGWLDKTYLGINENPLNITLAAAKVIKDHSKEWKITYAGDWHPELTEVLDDYSPVISSEPSLKELRERKAKGYTTTYYVCCTPAKPNNFVFSPPLESTYIGWYSAAYGYDGFLRWAYDAWPADPMRDARHTFWPAGDCFLVYPGGASSIRYEKLREGIIDFEKIRILRDAAGKSTDKKVKALVQELDKHLATFIGDRDYSKRSYDNAKMKNQLSKGKQLISDLSAALSVKP